MKNVAALLVMLLVLDSATATKKINTDFLNLLSSKTSVRSSQDAIESVMILLEDLQGANEEAQQKADQTFATFEAATLNDISQLSGIVNTNSKSVATAQEDLDAVELKIQQTEDYLNWNEQRYKSNEDKLQQLAEQRCEANALFIDTLREYKNALGVLDWVHKSVQSKEEQSFVEKQQVGEFADKLSKYANLFEEQALTDFVRLGNEEKALSQIKIKSSDSDLADLLVKDIVSLVQSLIDKLRESIKGLEDQEIKSANDFADFKSNLLAEQESLKQEYEAKAKFLNSLENDKELAQDILTKKQEILENGTTILSLTQDQYNEKKSLYLAEKAKRHEENQLLDEALFIYKEKIANVNEYLKKRVNEYIGDSFVEEKQSLRKQDQVSLRKGKHSSD